MVDDAGQIGVLEIDAHRKPVLAPFEAPCLRLVDRVLTHRVAALTEPRARGNPIGAWPGQVQWVTTAPVSAKTLGSSSSRGRAAGRAAGTACTTAPAGVATFIAMRLAAAFGARTLDATLTSFVFELTGSTEEIERFIKLMTVVGLAEVSRTGIAAMGRGAEGM